MLKEPSKKATVFCAVCCAAVFVAIEAFGWKYVGPLSIRNYCLLILVGTMLFGRGIKVVPKIKKVPVGVKKPNIQKNHEFRNKRPPKRFDLRLFKRFKYLVFYYIFVAFLGLFNGLYSDDINLFLTRFLPSIVVFCFLITYVENKKTISVLVYLLLAVMCLDAVATVLQGIGNPLGWVLSSIFSNSELYETASDLESSIGKSVTCGIMGTVVGNGYFLAVCGSLFWVPYKENKTWLSFLYSLFCCVLCLAALFYNQQRLAFYVYVLVVFMTLFYLTPGKRRYVFVPVGLLVLLIIFNSGLFNSMDLGRLSSVSDSDITSRHGTHRNYYTEFFPYHFLTGDRHEFVLQYKQTPHSMIIETLLLGGIIGLLLFMMFVITFVIQVLDDFLRKHKESVMYAVPPLVLLLISLEHSSGFHTGMTLGAFYFALYEKAHFLYRKVHVIRNPTDGKADTPQAIDEEEKNTLLD